MASCSLVDPRSWVPPRARSRASALSLGLAVIAIAFGSGCGSDEGEDDEPVLRVGAIFDLTGATSDVGAVYAEGIRDFVSYVNESGGVDGVPLELLYQDYGYRVDRAEMLYTEFVQEGVVAFMGWGTGDTEALRVRVVDQALCVRDSPVGMMLANHGR